MRFTGSIPDYSSRISSDPKTLECVSRRTRLRRAPQAEDKPASLCPRSASSATSGCRSTAPAGRVSIAAGLQVVKDERFVFSLPPHQIDSLGTGAHAQAAEIVFDVVQLGAGRVTPYVADGVDLPEGGIGGLADVPLAMFIVGVVGAHEDGTGVGGESE